ncbi:MAG: transglycosylase domain-containing protein [Sphingomonadaceae bacterium]|nr:transglycosylase domain-containing protein [Sphingomonadaceae bacterium]
MLSGDPELAVPTDTVASAAAAPPALSTTPSAPRRHGVFRLLNVLLSLILLAAFVVLGWLAIVAPPSRSAHPIAPPTVTLLASDGSLIARRGAIVDRPVDVRTLPAYVGETFIAIEDRRFYRHIGVDPHGLARAGWNDLRSGHAREGGSTITQQLAKLVYLDSDRTIARKAQEMLIALWLEAWLRKDQILSRYLSDAYFGDNVYGLRAAARHYFSKPPEKLTIGEAALLAGLMKAPSKLAPSINLAGAQARAQLVLAAMAQAGFISAREAATASATLRLRANPEPTPSTYFADWVLPGVREKADGYAATTVRTTLDARLQRDAEAAAARAHLPGAQVAIVAMRPDGKVVAMVGGRDYAASPFNRAVQSRRQPGSTFKLFVYLAALRAGMTPDSRIDDRPVTIDGWTPKNADRHYHGEITLRQAFATSSNMAAVRLTQQAGPAAVVQAARDLGIASPLAADPSIALGTSGISLLELTGAYAAIAGGAYPVHPYGLPDQQPTVRGALLDWQHHLDDRQRAMLLDLLSATVNSGTGRAAALSKQVFGKTGTSQDNRDAIFVGFAGGLVTAVWIGRDDNKPLPGVAGGGLPARIWRSFMANAIGARPLGQKTPAAIDPDAGIGLDIANALLGHLSVGVHLDQNGLHLSPDDDVDPDTHDTADGR